MENAHIVCEYIPGIVWLLIVTATLVIFSAISLARQRNNLGAFFMGVAMITSFIAAFTAVIDFFFI